MWICLTGQKQWQSQSRSIWLTCFFARKNKMSTVAGKLVAVQYFHRRAGIELPMRNPYLLQVKSGLARESAIHGEARRTRRPVSWVLLNHGIGLASEWGEGGRVLWLTLAVSYFFIAGHRNCMRLVTGRFTRSFV